MSVIKFGYFVKEKVRDLYEAAMGGRIDCVMFSMCRPVHTNRYDVLVVLCEESLVKGYTANYISKYKYCPSEYPPTRPTRINTKKTYSLTLEGTDCEIDGPEELPIQFQHGKVKDVIFTVVCSTITFARVYCYNRKISKIGKQHQ